MVREHLVMTSVTTPGALTGLDGRSAVPATEHGEDTSRKPAMVNERTAQPREARWSRTRGIRGRRAGGVLALVGILAVSATAGGRTTGDAAAGPFEAAPAAAGPISLSMAVKPGEPVIMKMVTEKSKSEYAGKKAYGQGIDVALIDSGVTPVVGLNQPGKVVYGPDLSNEGGQPNLRNLDTYGHGTHLAGIINGDDGDMVGGIAPQSRVVSVKVAGATGQTDIAQVIAGIDWVVEHRNDNGLNIRVLNLSLGLADIPTTQNDPLSAAVERAWQAGIVVVAAVGNRGNTYGGVDSPALSPYVIGVGAIESYDSSGAQDFVPSWTSGGNTYRQPDVLAPGRSIMSFRVPGSKLDQMHPSARVGANYFLGSGTSQAAAVVSGFSAAMLSRYPTLTNDQVKYLFEETALDIAGGNKVDGHGKLDPKEAIRSYKDAAQAPTQTYPLALSGTSSNGQNNNGVGAPSGATWSGGTWNGATWSGGIWSGATWSGATWSGATWSGGIWSGATWSGATWSGATWSGATWSGATWSGATWSGATWSGASWSGASWSSSSWS
jgi:serine protease AprX